MAISEVLRGTLKADGTLELENVPRLPAGPVEIVLRSLPPAGHIVEDWWQYLLRVRAEVEAVGGPFRSQEEIENEREAFRRGDERIDITIRQPTKEVSDQDSQP